MLTSRDFCHAERGLSFAKRSSTAVEASLLSEFFWAYKPRAETLSLPKDRIPNSASLHFVIPNRRAAAVRNLLFAVLGIPTTPEPRNAL